jgi:succinoglycan biosynthesis transport protein ExoP
LELELRHLFGYARRWWWLLVALPVVAGLLSYLLTSRQQPLYSATATLLIRPAQNSANTNDFTALQSGQRLATTYQQLVVTEPVLEPVAEALGAPYTVDLLEGKVSASTVRDTQLLKISVSDTSPTRAAEIADAVAAQFATFISEQELASTTTSQAGLQALIDDTEAQVEQTRQQIAGLEASGDMDAEGLRTRLSQLEQSLADLLVQKQNLDLDSAALQNQVRVYVPATVPESPYAPRIFFYTVLGVFLGVLIAAGTVALLEYLDNTVKSTTDFLALAGTPLMSVVSYVPKLTQGKEQIFVLTQPKSNQAEAMRLLRTNVEFAAATREITSLTVSSAGPGEGKSTVTANLGATMAQASFTAVIIDADLRRPSQHKVFELPNDRGMTTLLTNPDLQWRSVAIEVIPGLWVIPSGPLPPNPSDLLSSDRFKVLLEQVCQSVDIVLVDTPPVLAVSDPLIVSTSTDGVLLVGRAGHTRTDALERAAAAFPESVRRIGVVLNQQQKGQTAGYYYYGDYASDDHSSTSDHLTARLRRMIKKSRLNRVPVSTSSEA